MSSENPFREVSPPSTLECPEAAFNEAVSGDGTGARTCAGAGDENGAVTRRLHRWDD